MLELLDKLGYYVDNQLRLRRKGTNSVVTTDTLETDPFQTINALYKYV